jgi:hypothetical protein
MKVQELVGSKVWLREGDGPEYEGFISSIPMPIDNEDIKVAIKSSTFRIDLPSGDVVTTSGQNITFIAQIGYKRP